MTVEVQTTKVTGNGNGVATVFSFSPLVIFGSGDLQVTFVAASGSETTLSEGVDYSVSVATYPGTGSIIYPASGTGKLQTGEKLVMKTAVPITQLVALDNQGGYFPKTQEQALDKLTMIDLQQQEEIDRSIKFPVSDPAIGAVFPTAAERGGLWAAFDGAGRPIAAGAPSGSVPISATMQAVVAAATRAVALELLGFKLSDDGAAEGPVIPLFRDSASPAASDFLAALRFDGRSSTAVQRAYAKIIAQILDPTNASEDAELLFQSIVAGALATRMTLGQGLRIGTPTGGDPGAGKLNATGLQVNGKAIDFLAQAKAWVKFRWTGAAIVIDDSYGVSSVSRLGTGNYQINFSTNFANANYVMAGSTFRTASGLGGNVNITGTTPQAASNCVVQAAQNTTTEDPVAVFLIFFGQQ